MPQKKSNKKVKWISHYTNNQRILLVGEGDFSFSDCLARAFGSATNMVASSLDSERTLKTKHWTSQAHLQSLWSRGCLVLHGVNVHTMDRHPTLSQMKFDVIIFNFPHAGHSPPLSEQDTNLIKRHKNLLEAFLKNGREMLGEGGEVHVTLRDDHPYNQWNVMGLADKLGLVLKEKVEFLKQDFPGYHNKRGGGVKSNKKFPLKECFTFKFCLAK
ncbi:hypothetical protein CISIN_1g041136mg, partial [Citrus sinensis]